MATKTPVITPIIGPIVGPGTQSLMLHFIVSAKDLPMRDRGCVGATVQDPYIKWSIKDQSVERKEFQLVGKTRHRIGEPNPDYADCPFTFQWMKGTKQVWKFEVFDFDPLNKDDAIGFVQVDVDKYVEAGEKFYDKLSGASQGTFFIKKVQTLKFKLAAKELPKLDAFEGMSDPYVECYTSEGQGGPERLFHTTKVIKNVENCEWDEVIEFPVYQPKANQYWVFRTFDKDTLKHDPIGEAKVNVDEFVKSKGIFIVDLVLKKGEHQAKLVVTPVVHVQ